MDVVAREGAAGNPGMAGRLGEGVLRIVHSRPGLLVDSPMEAQVRWRRFLGCKGFRALNSSQTPERSSSVTTIMNRHLVWRQRAITGIGIFSSGQRMGIGTTVDSK